MDPPLAPKLLQIENLSKQSKHLPNLTNALQKCTSSNQIESIRIVIVSLSKSLSILKLKQNQFELATTHDHDHAYHHHHHL